MISILALILGIIAGLRAVMALAAISWAAWLGNLDLSQTWLSFLGFEWTPWIISAASVAELVNDKLPGTPSRKTVPQFAVRIVAGGISGVAVALPTGNWIAGLLIGVLGAVLGTLGGSKLRAVLASALHKDLPAALLEDALALLLCVVVVFWP